MLSGLDSLLPAPAAAAPAALTWRPPAELSDWQVVVGPKKYRVHTALVGGGERRSVALRDHIQQSSVAAGDRSTCLSSGTLPWQSLPEACWEHFEAALDFMYTGSITLSVSNVVFVFYIARTLSIAALLERVVDFLRSEIAAPFAAPSLLLDALRFPSETKPIQEECQKVCGHSTLAHYRAYSAPQHAHTSLISTHPGSR
jgi:hypothetical protein